MIDYTCYCAVIGYIISLETLLHISDFFLPIELMVILWATYFELFCFISEFYQHSCLAG